MVRVQCFSDASTQSSFGDTERHAASELYLQCVWQYTHATHMQQFTLPYKITTLHLVTQTVIQANDRTISIYRSCKHNLVTH